MAESVVPELAIGVTLASNSPMKVRSVLRITPFFSSELNRVIELGVPSFSNSSLATTILELFVVQPLALKAPPARLASPCPRRQRFRKIAHQKL